MIALKINYLIDQLFIPPNWDFLFFSFIFFRKGCNLKCFNTFLDILAVFFFDEIE